jgi:hypothetical protein
VILLLLKVKNNAHAPVAKSMNKVAKEFIGWFIKNLPRGQTEHYLFPTVRRKKPVVQARLSVQEFYWMGIVRVF